jgi:tetratricopeptide (TPR) repeat protein
MNVLLLCLGMLAAAPPSSAATAPAAGYPNEEALRRYLNGRLLEEQGARGDALSEYFRALSLDSDGAAIARRASEVSAARGDWEGTLEFARKALAMNPRDGEALWLQGTALMSLDREDEAFASLTAAVDADSDRVEFLRTLGAVADRRDDVRLAARCYRRAVWLDDTDGETWFQLATAEARLGRFGAADTALSFAADLNPVRPGLLFMQGLVDEHLGRLEDARLAYAHHLQLHPDDVSAHRQQVGVLARLKRPKDALVEARALTRLMPDELEFQRWHAEMAFEAGEPAEGMRVLDQLSAAHPGDYDVLSLRVGVLVRHDRARDGVKDVERELAKQPDHPELLMLAGRAAQAAKLPAQALQRFEHARTVAPDSLEPRVLLYRLHQEQKRYSAAESVLVEAVAHFPEVNGLRFDLAALRERRGDLPGAEAAVRDVLAREPDDPAALNFLGYLWADHDRNLKQAVAYIQRALEQDPENGAYLDSLGWAYYRLGRLDEARGLLERAVQQTNGDPVVHEHLGDVYKAMNLNTLALDEYRRSVAAGRDDPGLKAKIEHLR